METHHHIWLYRRDACGTIRSVERYDTAYPARRKADYALSDGRKYRTASQVPQGAYGAFSQPKPEEIVDRGMPFGPKQVANEHLADQAESIRPAANRYWPSSKGKSWMQPAGAEAPRPSRPRGRTARPGWTRS